MMHRLRRGMTLLELLVAMTVLGVTMSAGYGAFALLIDRRDALVRSSDLQREAAATRAQLAEWISHAQLDPLRPGTSFRGVDGEHESRAADELTFLTSAPSPLETSRTLITLRLDRSESGAAGRLVAELSDWNGARTMTLPLLDEVLAFDVQYAQSDVWLSSWISGSVLPRGVALRLTFADDSVAAPLMRLPVHVVIGGAR
jgi:prepilin-type N-terminal cleavage/methylation domain-containing protein